MAPPCTVFLFATLSIAAFGQSAVGLAGGTTSDSVSGKPVAQAQIIAHNLDKGTDRTAVSDADGIFTFTNLEPGKYEFAATKNGFDKSTAQVQIAALGTARVDLPLQIAVGDAPDHPEIGHPCRRPTGRSNYSIALNFWKGALLRWKLRLRR